MPNVHTRHISAILALTPSQDGVPALPPQIAVGLCHGLVTLGEEPPDRSCPYCYASAEKAKDEKVGAKIKYTCYRCKKVFKTRDIEKPTPKIENKEENFKQEVNEPKSEQKPKKKRKKELNAGLNIPPPKRLAMNSSLTNTVQLEEMPKCSVSKLAESSKSKNKLKFLMAKADPPKRGGLQDFLKKL